MPSRYRVRCVVRSEATDVWARITAIGGTNVNNTRWRITVAAAIDGMEAGQWEFYIMLHGRQVDLIVAEVDGCRYLKARNDKLEPERLLALPDCP